MSYHASTHLHIALAATALGFGLMGGLAAAIAKGIALVFLVRFVVSLFGGAKPTAWSENRAWPSQDFLRRGPPRQASVKPS